MSNIALLISDKKYMTLYLRIGDYFGYLLYQNSNNCIQKS
jgi:hypothetical protein